MSTISPALSGSILSLLDNTIQTNPQKVALIFKSESISFQDLDERSSQLANFLSQQMQDTARPICFCLEQSIEKVITMIAIWKIGGAYVSLDAAFTAHRLAHMLQDTASPILITTSDLSEKFSFYKGDMVFLDKCKDSLSQYPKTQTPQELKDKLAYLAYTSGSTGTPKAVMVEHQGLYNFIHEANRILETEENHIALQMASSSFDSAILDLWVPLAKGLTINLYPDNRLIGNALLDYICEHNINFLPYIPVSILSTLPTDRSIGALKKICTGGEAPTSSIINAWKSKVDLYNMYGPTETSVAVSGFKFNDEYPVTTIGKAFQNVNAYILDTNLNPVPEGSIGELCIGGVQVARGYLNQEELTNEKFIHFVNPQGVLEKIYKTGDLVYRLPDGAMVYNGRADQQVKIRGYRVEPGEIEENIYNSQLVNHCCVIVKDEIVDNKYLVCYYTNKINSKTYADEIRNYLVERLPAYMIPTRFLLLEEFPHTANGKVDKKALKAYALQEEVRSNFIAPSTPIQMQLASVWKNMLKIEHLGIQDNFFQFGGNSILAYKTIALLNKTYNFKLKISDLFLHPTLLQLEQLIIAKAAHSEKQPILEACKSHAVPLTLQQQSLWFLDKLHGSVAYNIGAQYTLSDNINIEALVLAFQTLLERNAILRSVCYIQDNILHQTTLQTKNWSLELLDTSADLQSIIEKPFKLGKDFMLRAYIVKDNTTNSNSLIMVIHHIAIDGWSMPLLVDELNLIYNNIIQKTELPSPKNKLDFYSYAQWQKEQNFATGLGFWKGYLADLSMLQLPYDNIINDHKTKEAKGALYTFRIDAATSQALYEIAQANNTTLYTTLLAAYSLLMQYYSQQNDICIGTVVANRNVSGTEDMLGYFANMLPCRIQIDGNPQFNHYLQQVQQSLITLFAHQDTPLEQIINAVAQERIIGQNPLFQTAFIVQQNSPSNTTENTAIQANSVQWLHNGKAKFDLQFEVIPQSRELLVNVEYKVDLFNKNTIQNLSRDFAQIINEISLNAQAKIGTFLQHNPIETITSAISAPAPSIVSAFEAQVAKNPNKTALLLSGKKLSYAELNEKANQVAQYIIAKGIQCNEFVGCYQNQSLDRVITLLGILKSGAAYLPLDTSLPTERLEMLINDANPSMIITTAKLSIELANIDKLTCDIEEILLEEVLPVNIDYSKTHSDNDLIYVIYTSGTTGLPKGVMVEHKAVNNFIQSYSELLRINSEDNAIQFSAINFDGSVIDLWIPLTVGATLHLYPNNKILGAQLSEFISLNNISVIPFMSPSVLSTFTPIEHDNILRVIGIGGESCPNWVSEAWQNKVKLVNVYGPTETTVAVNHFIYNENAIMNTLGVAIPNMRFYVLDSYLRPVRKGVVGELYISGVQLARGYLNQPTLTAEKFIPNPYQSNNTQDAIFDRLYNTGDQVKILNDGSIQYLGRKDHQVKIRGYRIELSEIENTLVQINGLEQAIVQTHRYGENNLILRAFIVGRVNIEEIKNILASKLPTYMIPTEFISIQEVPLTPNGKVDFKALQNLATIFKIQQPKKEALLPRTKNEKIIAESWSELLQCPIDNIEDDFFQLGGHSLLLTKLYNRLYKHYPNVISMSELYTNSTIKKLSTLIETRLNNPSITTYALGKDPLSREIMKDANVDGEMFKFNLDRKGDFVNPKAIFLTGATGFVGANLLLDLLKTTTANVYVLIRAKSVPHAEERLLNTLKKQMLPLEHYDASRVKILPGDLGLPFLGLSEETYNELTDIIDVVYHSGSAVNFIQPYSYMRPANVDALHILIKFVTTTKLKQLSLLSTVGVFSWEHYFTKPKTNMEDANIDSAFKYLSRDMGYTQSKWVMEKIAQKAIEQGVPIIIFRLGYIFAHSETGATADYQWWSLMVKTCIQLKAYPILRNQKEELVMVDFVSQCIAHISRNENAIGKNFHLSCTDENNIPLMDFFDMLSKEMGFEMKPIPYQDWVALWENDENSPLYPLLNLFKFVAYNNKSIIEIHQDTPDFDISNTNKFIEGTKIENRGVTKETLQAYCKYLGLV